MNLQARRISGSSFSAEDKLEVTFNSDNQPIATVIHTIELVSGVGVTHGGGGHPDDYLHYNSEDKDNGVIDYSKIIMNVIQEAKGTSVIKVVCSVVTQAQVDAENAEIASYIQRASDAGVSDENPKGTDGTFTEEGPTSLITPEVFKTGDITLSWTEDSFV